MSWRQEMIKKLNASSGKQKSPATDEDAEAARAFARRTLVKIEQSFPELAEAAPVKKEVDQAPEKEPEDHDKLDLDSFDDAQLIALMESGSMEASEGDAQINALQEGDDPAASNENVAQFKGESVPIKAKAGDDPDPEFDFG